MTSESMSLVDRLAERAAEIESVLDTILTADVGEEEIARPANLLAAMRYGVLNGGKRMRPFLVMETAALLGADRSAAARVGAAIECLHCYSLIHDDLPAMDDDDMRRGQPTVHVAFDEATAILAGDTLLTLAFEIIASPQTQADGERRIELIYELTKASGIGGMAGGQALDLAAETTPPDEAGIIRLQAMKTGALIRYSCEAGAILAGAAASDRERLRRFGEAIGLAFQLADDLLDVTGNADAVGKATGKDAAHGKATLVGLHGEQWAQKQLSGLVQEATQLLEPFGQSAQYLKLAARFIAERDR
ncbi:polyprenyl synthetase family protein [Hoeflea prorocentri]|uniref:Probable farnesyl diphosphate synthase n=1 Tax=Hoeflea prorocentri TaxID=1922333 RepID=A0A9X3ZK50_9HYPH|nr:farnesyl diphosphate synthase [Hoeflea prorocentri]MCY6383520.1 polyprenyl synthetase family protein [Hoeflea prorocentri]MDA5401320.1 polyprenyl synthetase family protein [Hoeflea prorocentri]